MDISGAQLAIYGLRVLAVIVFWFLARRNLLAAAVVQGFGYATYGGLMIPVIPHVWAVELGFVCGAVLLVEAVRQGLPRAMRAKGWGAALARLVLALFLVSILSYLLNGAAPYSRPVWRLCQRAAQEVLPCCLIALMGVQARASAPDRLRQCWRVGFWTVALLACAYLAVGLVAVVQGITPGNLRAVPVLGYYLGAGAGIGITFVIMSVYWVPPRQGWRPDARILLLVALAAAAVLTALSGTRSFVVLLPLVVCLCLIFPPPERAGSLRIPLAGTVAAAALLLLVGLSLSPSLQSALASQQGFVAERFAGRYGATGFSGRQEMWQSAWAMFEAQPILGGGEHNSGVVQTVYNPVVGRMVSFRMHQHSLYLKYLGEQGFLGGALLGLLILSFLYARLEMTRGRSWPAATAVIGQGAWVLGLQGLAQGLAGGGTDFFLGAAFLVAVLDSAARIPETLRTQTSSSRPPGNSGPAPAHEPITESHPHTFA